MEKISAAKKEVRKLQECVERKKLNYLLERIKEAKIKIRSLDDDVDYESLYSELQDLWSITQMYLSERGATSYDFPSNPVGISDIKYCMRNVKEALESLSDQE